MEVPYYIVLVDGQVHLVLPSAHLSLLWHSDIRPRLLATEAAFSSIMDNNVVPAAVLLMTMREIASFLDPLEEAIESAPAM